MTPGPLLFALKRFDAVKPICYAAPARSTAINKSTGANMSDEKRTRKTTSFRLREQTRKQIKEVAGYLTDAGPTVVSQTDVVETAVWEFWKKVQKKRESGLTP